VTENGENRVSGIREENQYEDKEMTVTLTVQAGKVEIWEKL
jgi:hypothetical protein